MGKDVHKCTVFVVLFCFALFLNTIFILIQEYSEIK